MYMIHIHTQHIYHHFSFIIIINSSYPLKLLRGTKLLSDYRFSVIVRCWKQPKAAHQPEHKMSQNCFTYFIVIAPLAISLILSLRSVILLVNNVFLSHSILSYNQLIFFQLTLVCSSPFFSACVSFVSPLSHHTFVIPPLLLRSPYLNLSILPYNYLL